MTDEPNWLPKHTTLGEVTIGGYQYPAKRNWNGDVWWQPTPNAAMVRVQSPVTRESFVPREES